jgi:hypoxanthine phosphoribosyltransferase
MANHHSDFARVLIKPSAIQDRVGELAERISNDYQGVDQLFIIGILKGAFIFLADLCRKINLPHVVDFMALSSYGNKAVSSGAVRIMMDLRENILGKHVLIVEDIVDTGGTLNYLVQSLSSRKPASLKSCVFLIKKDKGTNTQIDYLGFEIPNVWVVGYGLDFAETYRTLPFVAELKQSIIKSKYG